jgi:putative membrane protein
MRRLTIILLVLYAVLSAYSVLRVGFGLPVLPFFTPLLTLLATIFALHHGSQKMGWRKVLILLGLTVGVSLLFESVGVSTGLVYGKYHYTERLGFKFLGLVPIIIPAAWFMMMYPAYVIASRLVPANWKSWQWRLGVAALGGIVMTAWDLAMDPLMVSGGHWVWDQPGAYFGVPLQNYWGWWLTTFVTFGLFLLTGHGQRSQAGEDHPFDRLAVTSYLVTGVTSIATASLLGLSGPGLVGLFAMLPWVIGGMGLER